MERLRQHLTPRNLVVALVALLLIGLSVPIVPVAVSGPTVVSSGPADGVADANPQAPIRVEFDQWVSLASVAGAVRFDPPIEFTVGQAEAPRPWRSVVLIQPKDGLRYGARYQLTLDGSVRNMLGRGMAAPHMVAFATAPYVMVARSGPEAGAQKVALNAPITVEFGALVVPAERVADAAEDAALADGLPQPLVLAPAAQGVGRWLSPTLYGFYPAGGLHAATEYQATIRTDITSDGQARLEQAFTWRFTTEAQLLAGARPYDGATEVPADGPVEVRLAPDVDPDSAGQHFALAEAETGTPVEGTITRGGGGFLFPPAAPLQPGVRYEARLKPGVQTLTGKPLNASPLTWTFTVIGDIEVVQAEPADGTLEVPTAARRISVRFNHPVVALTTIDAQ